MAKKRVVRKKPEIKIVDELELLLPPLTDAETETLEKSLIRSKGPLNPIWLWKGTIVDGHNRYRACRKLDLPYETIDVWPDAKNLDEVKFLMKEAACGQRNLPDDVTSRFRAQMVRFLVDSENLPSTEAVDKVAQASGVSRRQVQRDVEKVGTIQTLTESCADADAVWKLSHNQIKQLALLNHEEQHALIERAGYDAGRVKQELRRISKVDGSPLNDATKKKAEKRSKEREARESLEQKRAKAVDLLGDMQKAAIKARHAIGITDGAWDRVRYHIERIDTEFERWKQKIKEKAEEPKKEK